jgi:membrane protease YdiL (CAAX protease family)
VSVSIEDRASGAETLLSWKSIVLVMAIAVATVAAGTLAGYAATAMFDIWSRIDAPRAFAAGEIQSLQTARVSVSFFAFQAVTILAMFAVNALLARGGGRFLTFSMPRGGMKTLILASLGLMVLAFLYGSLIFALDREAFRNDMSPFAELMKARTWWLVLIAAGIGAPIAEECLFRGLLYGTLRRTPLGIGGAAAVSAILWALLHANYSIYGVTAITLIGIYLALVRERTGSLLTPIVCHGAYNSLIVLVLAFAPNSSLVTG